MNEMFHFLLILGGILFFAKIFGEIALRSGQSTIIGELVAGIIMGPAVLGIIYETQVLSYMSELGGMILLFDVGLSINAKKFFKVGGWATLVAFVGIIIPYFLGYFVFLQFGLTNAQSIFAGAVLTATSIGVTARVFSDLKYLDTQEARIVIGAAVIDDVVVLGILAVVSELIINKAVTFEALLYISKNAVLFLVASVVIGISILSVIFKFISKMKQSNVLFIIGVALCFILSAFSLKVKLAPIMGAFIAGLVLSTIGEQQVEEIKEDIKPLCAFFVPIFFVLMGINVDINTFNPFVASNTGTLVLTGILFIVAFVGKALSGFAVLKKGVNKFLIGISMIPRGEVGLIFAELGLKNNVFEIRYYSSLVAVIILTTFITPIILRCIISKEAKGNVCVS
ncbi:MAG: cation:proton antiporter [Endomicrobium sp.]|jgi:Kef-type K+ transport system membrane component KefB|nr:cation:proton antiporter [Endomicrobium sp.]